MCKGLSLYNYQPTNAMGATMPHFKRIGLLGSLNVPEVKDSLRKLEEFLRSQNCEVIFEQQAATLVDWEVGHCLPLEDFLSAIDLAVVVGGDGSMLSACRKIASSNVPLLGINLGRLGFLTDITPDEIVDRVKPVLELSLIHI